MHDFRFTFRQLLKNPGFTAVAVLTLALGIGANTAIFTIIDMLLFKPIQARDPKQLVGVFQQGIEKPQDYRFNSYPDFLDIRATREVFEDVLAFGISSVALQERELTREIRADIVSANFFSLLGVAPIHGRGFLPEEDASPAPAAVLSYSLWQTLGGDARIVGTTLKLTRGDVTVVGIMPKGFHGTMKTGPSIYLPFGMADMLYVDANRKPLPIRTDRNLRHFALVGRLRAGLNPANLSQPLAMASERFRNAAPAENKDWKLSCPSPARFSFSNRPDQFAARSRPLAMLALGLSLVVLLVACLNLANMMLARGAARRKEIAVRLAMGAARSRIIRQLMTEGFFLALLGGIAGLFLSWWGTTTLGAFVTRAAGGEILAFDFTPDFRILGALLLFCAAATVIFALGPAWKLVRVDLVTDLKQHGGEDAGAHRGGLLAMRDLLAIGQIAFSLALLVSAVLFSRSAVNAVRMEPGFEMSQQFYAKIKTGLAGYGEAQSRELVRQATERITAIPGVQSASFGLFKPLGGERWERGVQLAGAPAPSEKAMTFAEGRMLLATYNVVGIDYFRTMEIPLLRGRDFERREVESTTAPRVAIVSANLAQHFWPGEDPLGKQLQFRDDGTNVTVMSVVGVVPAIDWELFERERPNCIYVPYGQDFHAALNLQVRAVAGVDAGSLMAPVREELRRLDPQLPITEMKTIRANHEQGIAVRMTWMGAMLFGAFGVAALLLSLIGVYGLRAYSVAQRTREIGIRMALGAATQDVLRLMLREGIRLAVAGLGVGLVLAGIIGRLASNFLYQVGGFDPLAFGAASLLLGAALLLACFIPARRAAKVDPMIALRWE